MSSTSTPTPTPTITPPCPAACGAAPDQGFPRACMSFDPQEETCALGVVPADTGCLRRRVEADLVAAGANERTSSHE
jgi:hypothetical protein